MAVEKAPALPFYGKQFYDDETVWLSSLAHQGLYVALLWHQWANGSIPSDVTLIARLVGQREAEVRRLWDGVRQHFDAHPEESDRLVNPQLEKVRADMVRLRQNRSKSGSKGGSKTQAIKQASLYFVVGDGEGVGVPLEEKEREREFEALWREYPRKRGRDDAQRHFMRDVATRGALVAITSAVRNYRRELAILGTDEQHTKHGSTFFNRDWTDYVDGVWTAPVVTPPPTSPSRPPQRPKFVTPSPE